MSFLKIISVSLILIFGGFANAQTSFSDSKRASAVIGQFFSETTRHKDFLSASPVGQQRSGEVMFVHEQPIQYASDYGVSFESVPYSRAVLNSYRTLGIATGGLAKSIDVPRAHLALNFANRFDLTASYILSDEFSGWGFGLKSVLYREGAFFFSHRIHYSRSERTNYFENQSFTNEFQASLYYRLFDWYAGVSHSMGKVEFRSTVPALRLPEVSYLADLSQLQFFYGVTVASTTNTRVTLQANHSQSDFWVSAKLSLHFDSLFPTWNDWFADPRRIKQ